MQKIFIGLLDQSEAHEFTSPEGNLIQTWKLGLMLTEDKGVNFFVGVSYSAYADCQNIPRGAKVRIAADSEIQRDGRVKYKLASIQVEA